MPDKLVRVYDLKGKAVDMHSIDAHDAVMSGHWSFEPPGTPPAVPLRAETPVPAPHERPSPVPRRSAPSEEEARGSGRSQGASHR
jgi:hypothetical protein